MYEVRVKFLKGFPHENRLKSFPTFAEARLWAANRARRSFPDDKISIYMDETLIETLDSAAKP